MSCKAAHTPKKPLCSRWLTHAVTDNSKKIETSGALVNPWLKYSFPKVGMWTFVYTNPCISAVVSADGELKYLRPQLRKSLLLMLDVWIPAVKCKNTKDDWPYFCSRSQKSTFTVRFPREQRQGWFAAWHRHRLRTVVDSGSAIQLQRFGWRVTSPPNLGSIFCLGNFAGLFSCKMTAFSGGQWHIAIHSELCRMIHEFLLTYCCLRKLQATFFFKDLQIEESCALANKVVVWRIKRKKTRILWIFAPWKCKMQMSHSLVVMAWYHGIQLVFLWGKMGLCGGSEMVQLESNISLTVTWQSHSLVLLTSTL